MTSLTNLRDVEVLNNEARSIISECHQRFFEPHDRGSSTEVAFSILQSQRPQKLVVVVGEVDRGKSALANALVGVKGMSPDGPDFTTTVPVAIGRPNDFHDDAEDPKLEPSIHRQQAIIYRPDGHSYIDSISLHKYICRRHSEISGELSPEETPVVTRAFVPVSNSALENTLVIDTPGVGGFDSTFEDITKSTLSQAGVLIFVCDSSTPITKPELDFIRLASHSIDSVIVVVSKIDKNITRWKDVVSENKRLLIKYTGRTFPVFPVSSLLATYDENMSQSKRDSIHSFSGIEELRAEIRNRVQTSEYFPILNSLRFTANTLREIKSDISRPLGPNTSRESVLEHLKTKERTLSELQLESEQWQQYLQRDLAGIRHESSIFLDESLDHIREKWAAYIGKHGIEVLRKNPEYFVSQIEQDFKRVVFETVTYYTESLKSSVIDPRFKSAEVRLHLEATMSEALQSTTFQTGAVRRKREDLLDPMILMMGLSGGSAISGLLVGLGAAAFTGVGAIAGAGWIAFNVGYRAIRRGKTNLISWLRESTNTARIFTNRLLDRINTEIRPEIVLQYQRELKSEIVRVKKEINDLKLDSQRRDVASKNYAKKRESESAAISSQIRKVEQLIAEINSLLYSNESKRVPTHD